LCWWKAVSASDGGKHR